MTDELPLFFDQINGAPPLPEVVTGMTPWIALSANPQADHQYGRRAHTAMEEARARVALLIGARPEQVLFGASGTEVNNLAIKGTLKANRKKGRRIVLSAVEHPSVERACRRMTEAPGDGYDTVIVGVDRDGRVDPDNLMAAVTDDTAMVCLQLANPEVGTVQPVADVARFLSGHRALLMVDAVAAAGRIPIAVETLGADLMTFSAPPMGGPAGAAALWVRRGVRIQPEIDGGVQEGGRRGGTENVAAIVGFGVAAACAYQGLTEQGAHLDMLADRLRDAIGSISGLSFTGPDNKRLPGHVSFRVDGIEGQSLLLRLDQAGIAASSGSYCGAKAMKASPVLTAMGYPPEAALSGVVFSFDAKIDARNVDEGARRLRECVENLRRAFPAGTSGPTA
ncbi:MAG: cysteine desulfurase family protein [Leptospirillia bacterium]